MIAEIFILVLFHILAAIIWIGAHFFEAFVLHISLARVSTETKYRVYSQILPRFSRVTGIAAVGTLYGGVMLATDINFGTLLPLVTTAWGIMSTLVAISVIIAFPFKVRPSVTRNLLLVRIGFLFTSAIAVLASVAFSLELRNLTGSSWGLVTLAGGILAVLLFGIGASQGIRRTKIGNLSTKILAGQGNDGDLENLSTLETSMLRMVIPENLVALAVIALMVYTANPF